MSYALCYVTAASQDEAAMIGRTLVEERLVACANILPRMTSIYEWEGNIEQAEEVVLLLKTRIELTEKVTARVQELHSYDVPCVLVLPIENGHPGFLNWIDEQTAKPD